MKRSVLIVDDHAIIRRMVCSLFSARGFEVRDAENGAEAVALAQKSRPNLVVLDLAMPVMNGLEAARSLKVIMPGVPLVMFSNTVGPIMEREARAAGISAVVSKSDSPDRLIEQANALLN